MTVHKLHTSLLAASIPRGEAVDGLGQRAQRASASRRWIEHGGAVFDVPVIEISIRNYNCRALFERHDNRSATPPHV